MIIAFGAVMIAVVFVVTYFAQLPISIIAPGSVVKDQIFDAGDVAIFIAAWTFGPTIGGLAGGIGSALSDFSYGSVFAPFTLVIKGCEGLVGGYFGRRESPSGKRLLSWAAAGSIMIGGYFVTNLALIPFFSPQNALQFPLIGASVEAPFDFLQILIGGFIGKPVSKYLLDSLPVLSSFRQKPKPHIA